MSTNYSASVVFGYSLPSSELERYTPNPLWGKFKFDPETGDPVTEFIASTIELSLEEGDTLRHLTCFTRMDIGETVLLGIEIGDTGDLGYGDTKPQPIQLVSDATRAQVEREIKKLLDKAGIGFDPDQMTYWLVGRMC